MNSSAPRLAEFPTIERDSPFVTQNLDSVPLPVLHEWVVRFYGESERSKLAGLPAATIVALYPEAMAGGVASFSLIRNTPILGQVQDFLDAVGFAMSGMHANGQFRGTFAFRQQLTEIGRSEWPRLYIIEMEEKGWESVNPLAAELQASLKWAVVETLQKSCPDDALDTESPEYWLPEVYRLAFFLCLPKVDYQWFHEMYETSTYDFSQAFSSLGLTKLAALADGGRR